MNNELRQHPRKTWAIDVPFSINISDVIEPRKLSLYGEIIDISASGLCITTEYPLEPGHVLSFGDRGLTGIVKWGVKFDNSYRFGIKFI